MKTLNDYILDAQRREERFLQSHNKPSTIPTVTKGTAQSIDDVLQPNYTTKDGIPCHNKATADFYSRNK